MSQMYDKRRDFPAPMRWLYAGGDRSRPNRRHQCANHPLIPSDRPPKCLFHPPDLSRVQTSTWRRASVLPTIEVGATINSP
jgi:hypothetical protein